MVNYVEKAPRPSGGRNLAELMGAGAVALAKSPARLMRWTFPRFKKAGDVSTATAISKPKAGSKGRNETNGADTGVVALIKREVVEGRIILSFHVHAGRSCALTWGLRAEVESEGERSTLQQAGLTNGLRAAPVCTAQFHEDAVGVVDLVVSEDDVEVAHQRLQLGGISGMRAFGLSR